MKSKTERYNDYQRKLARSKIKHRIELAAKMLAERLGVSAKELKRLYGI